MGKSATSSWTLIFNIATLVVTVGTAAAGVLPPGWEPYVVSAVAIANVILRLRTSEPIKTLT